jgi:hypothetical protein
MKPPESLHDVQKLTGCMWSEEQSDDSQVDDLTRLEELHKAAVNQLAKHQQAMR